MEKDWYVLATRQDGILIHIRIVAGPLSFEDAKEFAESRVNLSEAKLVVVQYDADF